MCICEVAMVAQTEEEGEDRGVKYWEDLRRSSNLFPDCMQGSSEVLYSHYLPFSLTICAGFARALSYFLLFGTLAFLILTLFLLFLSSLCRHDKGKKKKGERSCWQRSAIPARGPRCLGLVHHGRQSHLQIRRETLKRAMGKEKTQGMRAKKGNRQHYQMQAQARAHTHTQHIPVFEYQTKELPVFSYPRRATAPKLSTGLLAVVHTMFGALNTAKITFRHVVKSYCSKDAMKLLNATTDQRLRLASNG